MTQRGEQVVARVSGNSAIAQAAFRCDECGRLSIGLAPFNLQNNLSTGYVETHGQIRWLPVKGEGKPFPDVPEHIGSTADEAHRCLSIGAHRGAVALARAVVEATAKDHAVTSGSLASKIEQLASAGVISSAMKDAADEIRFAGNEVAHGDLAEQPITEDDAEEVLDLMDAILTRVYQEPRQVERVRERRQARSD